MYDTLVNAMRAQISPNVEILNTKVVEVATSDERQRLVLADGEIISARLIVLANGLRAWQPASSARPQAPRHQRMSFRDARLQRRAWTIDRRFPSPALTYWPKRSGARMAYLLPVTSLSDRFANSATTPRRRSRGHARPRPYDRRFQSFADRSRSGRQICMLRKIIGRPGSLSSATLSRPRARPQAPAPTRCSPTSNNSAMSTSRTGSRPKAWIAPRSRPSTTIPSRWSVMHGRRRKPGIFVRYLSTMA